MTNHNYSLTEIETLLRRERDINVTMLINHFDENKERLKLKAIKG